MSHVARRKHVRMKVRQVEGVQSVPCTCWFDVLISLILHLLGCGRWYTSVFLGGVTKGACIRTMCKATLDLFARYLEQSKCERSLLSWGASHPWRFSCCSPHFNRRLGATTSHGQGILGLSNHRSVGEHANIHPKAIALQNCDVEIPFGSPWLGCLCCTPKFLFSHTVFPQNLRHLHDAYETFWSSSPTTVLCVN
jgi:hypothetical protein